MLSTSSGPLSSALESAGIELIEERFILFARKDGDLALASQFESNASMRLPMSAERLSGFVLPPHAFFQSAMPWSDTLPSFTRNGAHDRE